MKTSVSPLCDKCLHGHDGYDWCQLRETFRDGCKGMWKVRMTEQEFFRFEKNKGKEYKK